MSTKTKIRVITLSSKGQVVIPEDFREDLKLKKGDHLAMIEEGDTIILKKEESLKDEFKDLVKIAEKSIKDIWDKKEEDIWNKYLE